MQLRRRVAATEPEGVADLQIENMQVWSTQEGLGQCWLSDSRVKLRQGMEVVEPEGVADLQIKYRY